MKGKFLYLMIFINVLSWGLVIYIGDYNYNKYNRLINQADECFNKKIYYDAINYYKETLNLCTNNKEIKFKLLESYYQAGMYQSYEKYLFNLIDTNYDDKLIIKLGNYYLEQEKVEKTVSLYNKYIDIDNNKTIHKELDKLRGNYKKLNRLYQHVSNYINNYCIYKRKNKYGIINTKGKEIVFPNYDYVNIFNHNKSLVVAPVRKDNEMFFIDKEEYRRMVPDKNYEYIGSFSKEGLAVVKLDNKFGFIDKEFNESNIIYEFASSFNNGVAVVKKDGKYKIIDTEFNIITDYDYDGVIKDELNFVSSFGVLFLKKGNKYLMVNTKGEELTKPIFEDAHFFNNRYEYAAIKIDGLWGYINIKGEIIIKPQYKNAKSFSCGLAPIQFDKLWGYIDKDKKLIIKQQFNDAKSFSKDGVAAVNENNWYFIKLLYFDK